ncbi:MAG: patatin-like phospholipase family protein [Acidimicrobiales bacterium]|jgi:NTE family protein
MSKQRIGLALSGGGFRATCFGLGCLRALHDQDLLEQVTVISGVSGGSVLTALYAYGPADFDEFNSLVVEQLRKGLQLEVVARALRPDTAARNLAHSTHAAIIRRAGEPVLRGANRTDALRDTLAARAFGERLMDQVTHSGLATVITATDLRTSNAMRFGSLRSSCSAYGTVLEPVLVAEAVAASGAFPLLLPAVERAYAFQAQPTAKPERHGVLLTDGGIYDNLGLSVLEPGRSASHTAHIYELDYIIACDAGRGRLPLTAGHFAAARMKRSFVVTYRRAQDASRGRLHDAASAGLIKGFVHAYLGMRDEHLPVPIPDIVPAEAVRHYPTDFRAISAADLAAISLRGEQLTRTLLAHYCSEL